MENPAPVTAPGRRPRKATQTAPNRIYRFMKRQDKCQVVTSLNLRLQQELEPVARDALVESDSEPESEVIDGYFQPMDSSEHAMPLQSLSYSYNMSTPTNDNA